jgi:hypothetical protein
MGIPKSAYGKSVSELIRMGYTDNEIREITNMPRLKPLRLKTVLYIIIGLYLIIILIGTAKVAAPYNSLQRYIASAGHPVQFIEKNFFGHFKAVVFEPGKAWHYVWSDEELIYLELLIEYSNAAGIDTREMEEMRILYKRYR